MAVRSSFNLKGILDIVRGKTHGEIGISQVIDGIEAKSIEILVPAASNWINIPLSFNSGVDEILIVHMYAASSLLIEIEDSSGNGDMVVLGLKGNMFWTFTPGNGVVAIRAKNESTSVNTTLELTYGCLQSVDDEPEYWQE